MRFFGAFALVAVSALGALGAFEVGSKAAPFAPAEPIRYFVDFDRGDDAADGRSAATAWRHAPGDAAAGGQPGRVRLRAGDTLLFAPGVRYRGEIRLNGGGEPGKPVVLTSAPGAGPGIIDGSDLAAATRPCRSAADCGGADNWARLTRADFAEPLGPHSALFADTGLLFPAQAPAPKDMLNSDAVSEFLAVDGYSLQRGVVHLPKDLARKIAGPGARRLVLELYGNLLATRDILSLNGTEARFDSSGLKFNLDRPEHFAVAYHPTLVSRPGEYGLLEGGRSAVVFLPPGARQVSVASGRGGLNLAGRSFVDVRGLAFENMNDDGPVQKTAINSSSTATDIVVEHNHFRNFWMPKGAGPIAINFVRNLTIADNDIEDIVFGSGMRLYKDANVVVRGNRISRIGRTGVMLIQMDGALVSRNVIREARGIHGNGISAYLVNHGVRIVANTVTEATRPITYKGDPSGENDLEFTGNLLIGTAGSDSALTSWAANTRVTITGNVLLGGRQGLTVTQGDVASSVTQNVMNGPLIIKGAAYQPPGVSAPAPAGWVIAGNREVDYTPGAGRSLWGGGLAREVADVVSAKPTGTWLGLCTVLSPSGSGSASIGADLTCPGRQAQR